MKTALRAAALGRVLVTAAAAQPVLAPSGTPPPAAPTPPPLRRAVPSAVETTDLPPTPWRHGPLALRPHLETRVLTARDLRDRHGNLNDTTLREFSPGLRLDLGDRWLADATVTWSEYTTTAFRDTFAASARLAGYVTLDDWHLHLSHTYAADDTPRTETGRQTEQHLSTTTVGLVRAFGEHWSSETSVTREARLVVDATDTREWRGFQGVNFRASSAVTLSGGFTAGWLNVDPGADLAYLRPSAEVAWQPGPKLTLTAEAGTERRWRKSGEPAPRNFPVGAVAASCRPFEQTTLALRAEEAVAAAYTANQLDRIRQWSASLQQRLLGHLLAQVERGEQRTRFLDTGPAGAVLRRDVTRSWQVNVSTRVFRRGTLGVFWRTSRNHSSGAFAYAARQTGVACSFAY